MAQKPPEKLSDAEKHQHLIELMKDFDTAMLVTRSQEGPLRSRPLAIAEAQADGVLYFATARESGKVHEVELDPQVNVSMQDKRRFVSVSGEAHIISDRALVDRLWSEAWKVWFPEGKDDPSLVLLAVRPTGAEYWDESGVKGLRYAFEAVTAYVKGTRPPAGDERQNARLKL